MRDQLSGMGAALDGSYYCPHHPEFGPDKYRKVCSCRKPKPGMLLKAAEDLDIDLEDPIWSVTGTRICSQGETPVSRRLFSSGPVSL